MYSNQFAAFCEPIFGNQAPVPVSSGLTTITLNSFDGVTGHIVGPNWARVKQLQKNFQKTFPGLDFSAEYDGEAFSFTLAAVPAAIAYINATIGLEISLANEAIYTIIPIKAYLETSEFSRSAKNLPPTPLPLGARV